MTNSKERLSAAQNLKKDVFSDKGRLIMPYSLAALAFGISSRDLGELFKKGKFLMIRPLDEDAGVEIRLEESATGWPRDLWEETLASLEKGRSEFNVSTYQFLYLVTQMSIHPERVPKRWVNKIKIPPELEGIESFKLFWQDVLAGKANLEGYDDYLQGLLCVYWTMLPFGIQQEHQRINPGLVRGSLAISS